MNPLNRQSDQIGIRLDPHASSRNLVESWLVKADRLLGSYANGPVNDQLAYELLAINGKLARCDSTHTDLPIESARTATARICHQLSSFQKANALNQIQVISWFKRAEKLLASIDSDELVDPPYAESIELLDWLDDAELVVVSCADPYQASIIQSELATCIDWLSDHIEILFCLEEWIGTIVDTLAPDEALTATHWIATTDKFLLLSELLQQDRLLQDDTAPFDVWPEDGIRSGVMKVMSSKTSSVRYVVKSEDFRKTSAPPLTLGQAAASTELSSLRDRISQMPTADADVFQIQVEDCGTFSIQKQADGYRCLFNCLPGVDSPPQLTSLTPEGKEQVIVWMNIVDQTYLARIELGAPFELGILAGESSIFISIESN